MKKIKEENMNVFNALIRYEPGFLDKPLVDLLPLRFMGELAVNAYRGLIKRLDDLPLAQGEKLAKLKDGQDAGKALLMIETRIGELLKSLPIIPIRERSGSFKGTEKKLPKGLNWKESYQAQAIASHPQEVAEVIKEAEANEDIPTKTAVLNKIYYKKEKEEKAKEQEKSRFEMAADAYIYCSKLREALLIIPAKPPKQIREEDFKKLQVHALMIFKRLEIFQNGKTTKNLKG